jgi:hypothetical protein
MPTPLSHDKLLPNKLGKTMNQDSFFESLLNTIKNKKWIALTKQEQKNFFQNDSDLLDRWEVKSPKELHKVQLTIPAEHINQLKTFNDQILEIYNLFDIWLKDKYQTNIVDFIDYQKGEIFLIKPVKYNF